MEKCSVAAQWCLKSGDSERLLPAIHNTQVRYFVALVYDVILLFWLEFLKILTVGITAPLFLVRKDDPCIVICYVPYRYRIWVSHQMAI